MHNLTWTHTEKKLARAAFDKALQAELKALVDEFKQKASQVEAAEKVWEIRDWLNRQQAEIDRAYDFRYSQLIHVFAHLILRQQLHMDDLAGLSDDKLAKIEFLVGMD